MNRRSRNILFGLGVALACVILVVVLVLALAKPVPGPEPPPSETLSSEPSGNAFIHTDALDMKVSVIDVGQGDSILIESEGRVLLVDAGDVSKGAAVVAYLQQEGVREIDYLVASHPHADHIGGMVEVFDAFDVDKVLAPSLSMGTKVYRNFLEAVRNEPDAVMATPGVGAVYQLGDATFEILANGDGATKDDPNAASMVIRVSCAGRSFLLTGDLPGKSEQELAASGAGLASDALKVCHHGSRHSSTKPFLDAVRPSYAVISCGTDNSYGHPHAEAVKRLQATGASIYRTDTQGTVVLSFSDGAITVPVEPVKKAA